MRLGRIVGVALIASCLGGVVFFQEKRPLEPFRERITFGFNEGKPSLSADVLRLMSFGYDRLFSNLLWLRFLQYTPVEKVPPGETSWIFYDLDAISTLDPKFYPVYEQGGVFLSVVTEDKRGAELLLLKGRRMLPERWRISAYLAYHYQHELGRPDDAYREYAAAARLPDAPPILSIFAARHIARTQSISATIAFLEHLYRSAQDETLRAKFADRIGFWRQKLEEEAK